MGALELQVEERHLASRSMSTKAIMVQHRRVSIVFVCVGVRTLRVMHINKAVVQDVLPISHGAHCSSCKAEIQVAVHRTAVQKYQEQIFSWTEFSAPVCSGSHKAAVYIQCFLIKEMTHSAPNFLPGLLGIWGFDFLVFFSGDNCW